MTWGLRSQAAGRKSRPSGDMVGIIKIRSLAPQYETKGINPLGLVRKLYCSMTCYFNRKPHTGIGLHGDDIFSSISLGGINGSRGPSSHEFLPLEVWLTSARPSSSQPRP
jgi:hypothetical protein